MKQKDLIKGLAGVAMSIAVGHIIMAIMKEVLNKSIEIEFDNYYIDDLRYHWKEMIEQIICENLSLEEVSK